MDRVYNFSAGPAVFPDPVLRKAQKEFMNYRGMGMSVMEMSHRSKEFIDIFERAREDLRLLLRLPETHEILFFTRWGNTAIFDGSYELYEKTQESGLHQHGTLVDKGYQGGQKIW